MFSAISRKITRNFRRIFSVLWTMNIEFGVRGRGACQTTWKVLHGGDKVSVNSDKVHSRVASRTLSSTSYREFKHYEIWYVFSTFLAFLCFPLAVNAPQVVLKYCPFSKNLKVSCQIDCHQIELGRYLFGFWINKTHCITHGNCGSTLD